MALGDSSRRADNTSVQTIGEEDGWAENPNPLTRCPDGKNMLCAAWSKIIDHVGQVFLVVSKIQEVACQVSTQVGFDYKYLKNESDRIIAECRFKVESKCDWKVHATRERNGTALVTCTYNNVHKCSSSFG